MRNYSRLEITIVALLTFTLLILFPSSHKTWSISGAGDVVSFGNNGQMIAYATGKQKYKQINPEPEKGSKFSVPGTSQIEVRTVNDGKIIQTFDFFSASSIAFSSDNNAIAIGGYGGEIEIRRIKDRKLLYSFRDGEHYFYETTLLAFSPDGKTLIAGTGDTSFPISSRPGQVSVRNLSEGQIKYTISERYICAASSSDGQLIALSGEIPINIYRVNDGSIVRQIEKNKNICSDLKFSADNRLLILEALTSSRGDIHIYRVEDGKLLHRMFIREPYRERQTLSDFALTPDNQYLVTSYGVVYQSSLFINSPTYPKALFGRIRIWNVENGKLIATLWGHRKGTNEIAISPDGKWLASAGRDSTIKLWKIPPRDYSKFWIFGGICFAALVYWKRTSLINWISR